MNHNKIYFIQTQNVHTNRRQCWVISSPSQEEAENYLVGQPAPGWLSLEDDFIISSDLVMQMVDTDEGMDGKTYIKIHN